jgi:Tol biopolymer transport system component
VDRGGKQIGGSLGVWAGIGSLRLSPDEKRFVADRIDLQTGNTDLWLSDVTGGNVVRFTFDPAEDIYPIWSPDGGRIVWTSRQIEGRQLYQKAASGAGQDELLLKSDYQKLPNDWSQDGRFIIYQQLGPKTRYDVWVLPVGPTTGKQEPFPFVQTEAWESGARLSPNGQWLAYASDESGRFETYVQSFPRGGGKRQVSTGSGNGPHWRQDGKELFYHAPDGKLMAMAVKSGAVPEVSFEASAPVALFEFRAGIPVVTNPSYTVAGDGQRFLVNAIVDAEPRAPLTVVVNRAAGVKK